MRTLIHLAAAVFIAVTTLIPLSAADDLPRLLLISVDGLMPSRYTSTAPAKIANLRRLMSSGVYAEGVIGVLPTVTYPSHTALVTGVRPAVHGILDNRILDPEGRSNGAWYWYARDIRVPTLPLAARARGMRAGAVSWPVTVGVDLDYVVPEFWRSDHPEGLKLLKALSWPRDLIDAAEIAQGQAFAWPHTDRERSAMAKFIIRTYQPHVLLVHLIDLDGAQHDHGPESQQALDALEQADGYIGEILDTLESSALTSRTHVAVVSDHGFLPLKQQLQPNAAFKEAGLVTVNDRGKITSWQAYFHPSGGSGFVYLQDPGDAQLRDRVHALLQKLKADSGNGIRRIWTQAELEKAGAHPNASFALDVVDGFYTGGGHDRLVVASESKGGHGFDPARSALHASFIASGPAITRRGSLGVIRMTQIAPTLARTLGVGLSPLADEPLRITNP